MTKELFFKYVSENFNLDTTSRRLTHNILDYLERQPITQTEKQKVTYELLRDIGLTEEEASRLQL
ncbi:hypothetical protein B5F87_16035 [Eubacterium sp. An3]|nr:hypothetical protein B5F87_16035 [Eubacterium sp. An3]